MIARHTPDEAYRRVDFDARVAGAGQQQLVGLCYEQLVAALGTAIFADRQGDNALKSRSLTRALTALTALQMGVSGEGGVADSLRHLYEGTKRQVLDCVLAFDGERLEAIRSDFNEIAEALAFH